MMQHQPILADGGEDSHMVPGHEEQFSSLLSQAGDNDLAETEKRKPPTLFQQFRSRIDIIQTGKVLTLPGRFCDAFVPQIIRTLFFHNPIAPPKVHSNSWLDGFRRLAALAVFNPHFSCLLRRCSTSRKESRASMALSAPCVSACLRRHRDNSFHHCPSNWHFGASNSGK
jgi:hypothetical protein